MKSNYIDSANLVKVDLVKRFLAAGVDCALAGVLFWIPFIGPIAAGTYILIRDGLDSNFADGRSIGKKLLNLRPVRLDNQPMDFIVSIQRNLPLALFCLGSIIKGIPLLGWLGHYIVIPLGILIAFIEGIIVLFDDKGLRIGDRVANTILVEEQE